MYVCACLCAHARAHAGTCAGAVKDWTREVGSI